PFVSSWVPQHTVPMHEKLRHPLVGRACCHSFRFVAQAAFIRALSVVLMRPSADRDASLMLAKKDTGREPMKLRATSMIVAALAAMISASPAQAGGLKQVAEISIPGDPITDIGIMAIDQTTGLGYLADKTNKSVVVFDTKTDKFVARIPGFVGLLKDGNASGPNGVVVVGAEVWVSDGDSTIKVVDTKTGQITGTIATGGTKRANGMALGEDIGVVIVANSNDDPPFLSFISTASDHKILAKIPIPESGENLERSAYHAPSRMFYTAIPVSRVDATKGLLAQTDPKNGKLVKLHELAGCHPHSLSIVSDSTIFLGCSSAHGPSPKPGG